MLLKHFLLSVTMSFLVFPLIATAQQQAKDHPLVSRFPGSDVLEYKTNEFDEFSLPLGKIIDENQFTKAEHLEGKITKFKYSVPKERSSLEVARSYQSALESGGFQILFQCSGADCRAPKSFQGGYRPTASGVWCFNCAQPMHYLAAKLPRASGDVYVSLVVEQDQYEGGTWLTIVEVKPMQGGLVTVNAAALANDIAQTGHASVYGIYFDTGKAALKPESDATLTEISKLLASNPQLKLHVVGHTDHVGTLASNMTLSKQRADAVVASLVSQYRVAAARLLAAGVGPLAPVATNRSEEGRAKNRRVELVEQ
jgi:OmpA-OmpF porin, OOP family